MRPAVACEVDVYKRQPDNSGVMPLLTAIESYNASQNRVNFDWRTAVTRDEAWNLANHWVAAWNAHDLDLIMTCLLYTSIQAQRQKRSETTLTSAPSKTDPLLLV